MSLAGLPGKYRFQVYQNTGQLLKVALYWRGQKLTSTGELDTDAALKVAVGDPPAGGGSAEVGTNFDWKEGGALCKSIDTDTYDPDGVDGVVGLIDNLTNKHLGIEGWWKVKCKDTSVTANGHFTIVLQSYNDDATVDAGHKWPPNGTGIIVASTFLFTAVNEFTTGGIFTI